MRKIHALYILKYCIRNEGSEHMERATQTVCEI